ncbi:uncharacterized protein F4812DRAFT_422724 [Daldinia caldariorum]|uniref:uncharacterized protein n=1 Tax=Daldinia caldariorum TaxID=326644 RepID=UPI0020088B3C|nr:uncharacterized protein F4812DRAFT_422724 [Daldinia caldariorum]KAI1469330.1 hypothetical protein F4812DRAFT_422724 [Daldinia caldariorum]
MEGSAAAAHRKIELQAPEDLAYLLANVRRAAAARLDEAFPPVDAAGSGAAADGDELRTRIEELVNEYIVKTFTLAGPNLSINGMPVDTAHYLSGSPSDPQQPEEVFEPFDARKRARLEELTREEEDLLRDIAALKKSVPHAAAASWAEASRRAVADDEQALAAVNERAVAAAASGEPLLLGAGDLAKGLPRQDDIESGYEDAVKGLGRLKREMPSVVARMERARGAGEYVVTER